MWCIKVEKSPPLLKGSLLKGSSLWKGSAFRPWELELLNMAILDLTNESSWNTHSIQLVFALLRGENIIIVMSMKRASFSPVGHQAASSFPVLDLLMSDVRDGSLLRKEWAVWLFDRGPVCGRITLTITRVKALWRICVWRHVVPI